MGKRILISISGFLVLIAVVCIFLFFPFAPRHWHNIEEGMHRAEVKKIMENKNADGIKYTNMFEVKGYDLWTEERAMGHLQVEVSYSGEFVADKEIRFVRK